MLAVKTTCKDRWRQILNEADKIHQVHLFTLQEGVSLAQYREMRESGVRLVVPSSLHKKYPEAVRAELMTLGAFIAELTGFTQIFHRLSPGINTGRSDQIRSTLHESH